MSDRPIVIIIVKIINQVYRLGASRPVYAKIIKILSTKKTDKDK